MKKAIALVLALTMVFALVACAKTETTTSAAEEKAETTEAAATVAEETTETTEAESTADPAKEPIVVGVYMPLTGSNAGSGTVQLQGIQMAFDEANAAGGIDGRQLEIISYDSAGTSEGAMKAATRLIEEDGVQIIIGSFLSANILAVSELTEEAKVLHVGAGTGATWTNIGLDYTYRATANGSLPIATSIEQLAECGYQSIALIYVESDYGQSGHDSVVSICAEKNIEIKTEITYQSADTDFTGVISKALKSGADTIYVYGQGEELALITKQLRANGYDGLIFTVEGGANSEVLSIGGAAADGIVFAATYVVPDAPENGATELIREVLQKYYSQYGEMPFSDCFYRGYDEGSLVVEALRNAADPDSGESVKEAFKAITGVELLGGTFDYTAATGDGLTQANKWMILDGKIQPFAKDDVMAILE